jgi:hypothetical protein
VDPIADLGHDGKMSCLHEFIVQSVVNRFSIAVRALGNKKEMQNLRDTSEPLKGIRSILEESIKIGY